MKYKALFFDLDHTLWDYDTSSLETLHEIHSKFLINKNSFSPEDFVRIFHKVNDRLWNSYNKGNIGKDYIREQRFQQILEAFDIKDSLLSEEISKHYLFECPRKPNLIDGTLTMLEALSNKYDLHILTNGFEDVQNIKLESSNIHHYFDHIITSDGCGHKKPSKEFFDYAFNKTNTEAPEAIMIGDNLKTDIAGGLSAGLDTVYYNPSKNGRPHQSTYEISHLSELVELL